MRAYTRIILAVLLIVLTCAPMTQAVNIPAAELVFPNIHSGDLNPAILGISPYIFDLRVAPEVGVYTNTWTVGYLLDNLNQYWDEAKKDEILAMVAGDALGVGAEANAGAYLGIMNLGLSVKAKANVDVGIDKNILRLALKGTEWDISEDDEYQLKLDKSYAEGTGIVDGGMSYAIPFKNDLYIGVGLHYLLGVGFVELADSNFEADVTFSEEFKVKGIAKADVLYANPTDGGLGHGFALDLGVWKQLNPKLGVGAGLTNFGQIYWHGVKEAYYEEEKTIDIGALLEDPDSVADDMEFSEPVYDQLYNGTGQYTQATPMAINISCLFRPLKRLELAGNISLESAPVSHTVASVATKIAFIPFLPLTISGTYDTLKGVPSFAGTLGIHLFGLEAINLTLSDLKLIEGSSKELNVGISTGIRF